MGHLLGTPPARAHAVPMSNSNTTTMLWTAVNSLQRESAPLGVHAYAIDTPTANDHTPGAGVEFNGWVIGQHESLSGVRAVGDFGASCIHQLDVRRPDVAAEYPSLPHAALSGFSFWLPLPDAVVPWRASIEAMFPDGQAVTLAELRGDVVRKQRITKPGLRLVEAPDFVIIGTQRGGTTSLHAYLSAHPQVHTPATKELHFLTDRFARGRDWYIGQFPSHLELGNLTGESTPYSLFHPLAPQRLRAIAPDAKLIVLLRNPVDRAYSHYLMEQARGDEPLSFPAALDAEAARLAGKEERLVADPTYVSAPHKHASYVARGDYAPQLERWFATYPREQFLILRSEDLYARTAETFARVTSFLGLPPVETGPFAVHNQTTGPSLDLAIRDRLSRHFAPLNMHLARILSWNSPW